MKHKENICLALLAAGLLCTGLMFGADASAADRNPCSDDIAKFCKDVKPGGGAIMDCLEQHEGELSDACREHESQMGGKRVEIRELMRESIKFRQACKEDVDKFCKDVKPGPGVVIKCLNEHKDELSAQCSEKIKAAKQAKENKKAE